MTKQDLIKKMKDCIGEKEPIEFFHHMVDAFEELFKNLDSLNKEVRDLKTRSTLSIQWEPKVASNMLSDKISEMRDNDLYTSEYSSLKKAYVEDRVTQNYHDFCEFWVDILGYHPFLDY